MMPALVPLKVLCYPYKTMKIWVRVKFPRSLFCESPDPTEISGRAYTPLKGLLTSSHWAWKKYHWQCWACMVFLCKPCASPSLAKMQAAWWGIISNAMYIPVNSSLVRRRRKKKKKKIDLSDTDTSKQQQQKKLLKLVFLVRAGMRGGSRTEQDLDLWGSVSRTDSL